MLHIPVIQTERGSARSRIYRYLYENKGFCSRQTLARKCKISLPTLYQNLSELMESGLVRYSGQEQATGGRKAQGLEMTPDARFAVGVSVLENSLRIVAADLRLNELAYQKIPFSALFLPRQEAAEFRNAVDSFLDENHLDRSRLLGIGVTIPGVLTPECDRIVLAPTLNLSDTPLDFLTKELPYPVFLKNDASSSGYAEWYSRSGSENMAYLSLENGVGGAVLIEGIPYEGDNSRSGELGHICVEQGGLLCSCGRRGCLEAYCTARRITNDLGVSLEDFFTGVDQHVPEYEALWFDMLRHLAIGINIIRMVLDCDVVIGGFLSEYLEPYLPALKRYVLSGNPFEKDSGFVHLSTLRKHTAPLGAALPFIREFVYSI